MQIIKKILLLVLALFMTLLCLGGILFLVTILKYADFQQGKWVIVGICILMIGAFGFAAFICFKLVFHKEKVQRVQEEVITSAGEMVQESVPKYLNEQMEPVETSKAIQEKDNESMGEDMEVNAIPTQSVSTPQRRMADSIQRQNALENTHPITGQQVINQMRIMQDSMEIMEKTSDIDTFLSRYETAMRCALTLEQAKKAGVPVALADGFSQALSSAKNEALKGVLYRSYQKELDEICKLKTESGKLKRINRYQEKLKSMYDTEFQFVVDEDYNDIMQKLELLKQEMGNRQDVENAEDVSAEIQNLQDIVIRILTRSVTRKLGLGITFETTDDEDAFFRELVKQTIAANLNPNSFYFEPMSNKSFSVYYQNNYIGKVKLSGKNQFIQVLGVRGAINTFSISSTDDYREYSAKWVKYIKHCLK